MNTQQRVIITGGAGGLGRALALRYARAGWKVCITDLNDSLGEATLAELLKITPEAMYCHADVTQEADLQAVAQALQTTWGGVDVLVNNAGVAGAGAIEDTTLADWEWIININLLGVVRGCRVFTPMFKRQGHGQIINIASMAGLLDVPLMASYNVSKAAVVALSGTLEQELMADNIAVSVVCPSFFKTNLDSTMRSGDPHLKKMVNKLLEKGALNADLVADCIFTGAAQRKPLILPHAAGARMWLAKRFLPHAIYTNMLQKSTRGMRRRPVAATAS
ncbi:SDR family oxidoreductase [Oxalobacteraceae bacterium]|nr:SDR family oxidoreductase [Oxalobacteraceae bacterium]